MGGENRYVLVIKTLVSESVKSHYQDVFDLDKPAESLVEIYEHFYSQCVFRNAYPSAIRKAFVDLNPEKGASAIVEYYDSTSGSY